MEKIIRTLALFLCLALLFVGTFIFIGCENNKDEPKNEASAPAPEIKTCIDAVKFFEEKDYYVETMSIEEFWGDDSLKGTAVVAFDKTNVDEEEYGDWDGDAFYQTKNIVYILYFEDEFSAQSFYSEAKELATEMNSWLNEVEEEDLCVAKEIIFEIHGGAIYIGTPNAIDMAK